MGILAWMLEKDRLRATTELAVRQIRLQLTQGNDSGRAETVHIIEQANVLQFCLWFS